MAKDKGPTLKELPGNFLMKIRVVIAGSLAGIVGYLVALVYASSQSWPTPWPELMLLAIAIVFKVVTQKAYISWLVPWIVRKLKDSGQNTYHGKELTEREAVQSNILLKTVYEAAAASTGAAILLGKAGWETWAILWVCTFIAFSIGCLEHWSDPMENVLRREINLAAMKSSQQAKRKSNRKKR